MRFDLTDLRLFLAVVDAGSITHGAAEAGLSLPAASERLRDMEAVGEVELLERGRRGVKPTEAGEALAHHARLILGQMTRMRSELGEYAKGLRAVIRVLANTAATTEFLPERLATWMATHPQIDVKLRERQSMEIARSIAAGLADIGILSDAADTDALHLQPFAIDRLVVVTALDHPLAAMTRVRFAELVDQHFIGLAAGALQDHIDAHAATIGVRLKFRVKLRTFDGICQMVGKGVGIGIVPETVARRYKRRVQIALVPLADEWATRQLSVCVRRNDELAPPAKSLFEHLTSKPLGVRRARSRKAGGAREL
ncbi:LysR family transcriptional regulator [Telmatospirillum sp.]|uniref:LysR family transcriptional regulator n=1 Tax=Telmatospirillum sp. TaxID=2079197 RepID=UPI00285227EE|nr:LysR family transcriptional regulator [Telmatospirillum sp.]MDR3436594.1 LysR family transcriptional regulator [Telmatospirillum sp.]